MLYLAAIDDADTTHATSSTADPQPLCGHAIGRTRVQWTEDHTYDMLSATSVTHRKPLTLSGTALLTCPECRARLAPEKIRALTLDKPVAKIEPIKIQPPAPTPTKTTRVRKVKTEQNPATA